ncbi:hypothetical protein SAMN05444161_8655 [Rhizobiales bacterium GAS191]|nr:hypothetical protein SAMN05444161_8655 [Rhizobiales bacterium GAS191]
MTPDVVGALRTLVKNPYLDTYKKMPEHELTVWREIFEQSIALRPSREKVLRLCANRALRTLESARMSRAAWGKSIRPGSIGTFEGVAGAWKGSPQWAQLRRALVAEGMLSEPSTTGSAARPPT